MAPKYNKPLKKYWIVKSQWVQTPPEYTFKGCCHYSFMDLDLPQFDELQKINHIVQCPGCHEKFRLKVEGV